MSPLYSNLFAAPTYISAPEAVSLNDNVGLINLCCVTSDASSGEPPKCEIVGKANPNIPSAGYSNFRNEVYNVAEPKI
jgi:hypothetical protein